MKKLILMIFVFLIVATSIVSAQPPFQQVTGSERGLDLRFPPAETIKIGENVTAHMHVHNSTDGLILTNTSVQCFLHLYDTVGTHIIEQEMEFDSNRIDFEQKIFGNNFSKLGMHSFIIWCNSTLSGGFVSGGFEVTQTGTQQTTAQAIMHGIVLFLLLVFLGVCFFFAVHTDGNNEFHMGKLIKVNYGKYFKQLMYFISYLFFTFVSGMAWIISANYLNFEIGTVIFKWIFTILWILVFPIFIAFVVISLIKYMADIQLEKLSARGLPQR